MARSDGSQQVAIVTGGSHGIGAGLVTAYRAMGWAVVANSRSIRQGDDPGVLAVAGDISEPAACDRIVAAALGRFGRLDTLINNAGIFLSRPFTDYTEQDYAKVVAVNLTGFFLMTQRVIAEMRGRGGGHIVSISTTLAEYANAAVPAALTALTKGGIAAATRSLRRTHPPATTDLARCTHSGELARSATSSAGYCSSSRHRSSLARSSMSTAARAPATRTRELR
jgi:NAD(P)-dependent dehydrogenase (short-subunit alcohol dehydrogenase family)